MDGKYIKKNKKVINLAPLTLLATLANSEDSMLKDMTGKEVVELLNELPSEIRIVMDTLNLLPEDAASECISDSDYDSLNNYKQVIVRVNGLNPGYAKQYKKSPVVRDGTDKFLITDLKSKEEFTSSLNGIPTVASMTNFIATRKLIESAVGLKDLYTEIKDLGHTNVPNKRAKLVRKSENEISLEGGFDIELVGNFTTCDVSLADIYMYNNKLREVLLSGRGAGLIGKSAVMDKIVEKATPDSPYAAVASYYGAVNTDDTFKYSSRSMIRIEDFIVMLGKFVNSTNTRESILKNANFCGFDPTTYLNRYNAIKLASQNLGAKVQDVFNDAMKECEDCSTTASMFFNDIHEGDEYDTTEVASFYTAGLIRADEYGNVLMNEGMTMSKVIRLVFSLLECALKIDLDTTEYINIDKVS